MCINKRSEMRISYGTLHVDMCTDKCAHRCTDKGVDMCVDKCVDMRMDRSIDVCKHRRMACA